MKKNEFLYLAVVIILAALWRLLFLVETNFVIDSDEAIVGLMARDILAGSSWPIFYYGQNYMGSLEAILTASVFWLIGPSSAALKVIPLLFSLYLILAIYVLTERLSSKWAARVAVVFAAFPPSALTVWSTKARGGFIEIIVFGTIALLLTYLSLFKSERRLRNIAWLGALVGVGWWTNNQMVYYAISAALVFALVAPLTMGIKKASQSAAVGALFFFLGSFPFWFANLFQKPRFSTFSDLLGRSSPHGSGFADHFFGFVSESLPILVGAARFWSDQEVFSGAKLFFLIVYLILFVFFSRYYLSTKGQSKEAKLEKRTIYFLSLAFVMTVILIFSASSFGWLSTAPRYLLPLYSVLFFVIGVGSFHFRETLTRRISTKAGNIAVFLLLGTLFIGQASSNFYKGSWYRPGQPVVFLNDRVSADQSELYQWLEKHNHNHIFTNYWIGYRAAFETAEKVLFSRYGEPRDLRIPSYESNDDQIPQSERVYVLGEKEAVRLERQLSEQGFRYQKDKASNYTLVHSVEPIVKRGEELVLNAEMISATHQPELLSNILDGDESTRWGSGAPQSPGMAVEIEFASPTTISGLDIDYGDFIHDAPRALVISALDQSGAWVELFKLGQSTWYTKRHTENGQTANFCEFYLKPLAISKLRLEQVGEHPVFDWSIANIVLYGWNDSKNSEK